MSLLKRTEKKKALLQEIKDLTEDIAILKDPEKKAKLDADEKEIKELEELKKKAQDQADQLKEDLLNKDVTSKTEEELAEEIKKSKALLETLLK